MGILSNAFILVAGAVLATYDTNVEHPIVDAPRPGLLPGQANNSVDPGLPDERPVYVPSQQTNANIEPGSNAYTLKQQVLKPSESLNLYEWMDLMHELGYYADGDEPVARFWERLDAWDADQLLLKEGVVLLGAGPAATGGGAHVVHPETG